MKTDEKVQMIKLLTELNGLIIEKRLVGKSDQKNIEMAKKVAKSLEENGIGKFDFSSDEKFNESLSDFLKIK